MGSGLELTHPKVPILESCVRFQAWDAEMRYFKT
jgi:hypothetical protein